MSFFDELKRVFTGKGLSQGPLTKKLKQQSAANARSRNYTSRGQKASGDRYTAQANLAKKRSASARSNKAWGDRYQKQADVMGTKKPKPSGGGGGGGGGGGESYDDGSSALQDVMNQISQMTTPSVEIPQINIGKTLASLFDPQFKQIGLAEGRTKTEGKRNSKEVKAAYKALEQSISKDDAKAIDKSYKQATASNKNTSKSVTDSMSKAMSAQAEERRKDAQNLGIETALAQDSGAQKELAKGIADTAKSTNSQNQRLQELKKADQQLNRDAAQTATFTGNETVSTIKSQVAEILAGLTDRRLDTTAAKANKKLELQTQNQNAVTAGRDAQAKEAQAMMNSQVDMLKSAQDMQLEQSKLMSKADIEKAKLKNKRYEVDAKYANQGSKKDDVKNGSVLEQLAAMRPGGLGTKSLQGVISNMDSFYASGKGTWADAYKQYANTYKKSARSKDAAREYLRLMGKR